MLRNKTNVVTPLLWSFLCKYKVQGSVELVMINNYMNNSIYILYTEFIVHGNKQESSICPAVWIMIKYDVGIVCLSHRCSCGWDAYG